MDKLKRCVFRLWDNGDTYACGEPAGATDFCARHRLMAADHAAREHEELSKQADAALARRLFLLYTP